MYSIDDIIKIAKMYNHYNDGVPKNYKWPRYYYSYGKQRRSPVDILSTQKKLETKV